MNKESRMKKIFQLLAILILFTSCGGNEVIEFRQIKNIKLTSVKEGWIELEAEAEFNNPSNLSGKIRKADIDISVGNKLLAEVSLRKKLKIKKSKTIVVPLRARFRLEDIQENFLDNLLAIVGVKKLELHFKGKIKVSKCGLTQSVPLDYKQEVQLK